MVAALTLHALSLIGALDLRFASNTPRLHTHSSTLLTMWALPITLRSSPRLTKNMPSFSCNTYISPSLPLISRLFLFLLLGDYSLAVACVTQDFLGLYHKNHTRSACIWNLVNIPFRKHIDIIQDVCRYSNQPKCNHN
jgi:hypothetical protein